MSKVCYKCDREYEHGGHAPNCPVVEKERMFFNDWNKPHSHSWGMKLTSQGAEIEVCTGCGIVK